MNEHILTLKSQLNKSIKQKRYIGEKKKKENLIITGLLLRLEIHISFDTYRLEIYVYLNIKIRISFLF